MTEELAQLLSKHNVSISCEIRDEFRLIHVEDRKNSSNYCGFMCYETCFLDNWINLFLKPAIGLIEEKRKANI